MGLYPENDATREPRNSEQNKGFVMDVSAFMGRLRKIYGR